MGHSLHTETITTDRADRLRGELKTSRPASFWGFRPTFESEMVREAVARWREDEAGRHDGERAGDGYLTPVMSAQQARDHIERNHDRVVSESAVIPIAQAADLIEKTRRVHVALSAKEMRELRKSAAAAERSRFTSPIPYELRERVVGGIDGVQSVSVAKLPAARKVAAKTTAGKLVAKYRVVAKASQFGQEATLASCDTIADARAAGIAAAEANPQLGELSVIAELVRVTENGAETAVLLTIGTPEREETTVEFKVTTVTAKPDARIDHYEVTFDYHH